LPQEADLGSKGVKSEYDPQIGAATQKAADTASQAQAWSQHYYDTVITPMLKKQSDQADVSAGQQNKIFDTEFPLMQAQAEMQQKYAMPAQQRFYDQAAQFSSPQEMEREAAEAKSDSEQAIGAQNASRTRQMASLGIQANSPAAIEAAQSATVANAANQAGAMNRARNTARQMGLNVSSQAAGFGNTGAANVGSFAGGASTAANGAFGIANGALGGAISGASVPMQGYATALSGYNNNVDAWAKLGAANITADASTSLGAGFGKLAGALGGAAINKYGLPGFG
jgi:hypothetical protein